MTWTGYERSNRDENDKFSILLIFNKIVIRINININFILNLNEKKKRIGGYYWLHSTILLQFMSPKRTYPLCIESHEEYDHFYNHILHPDQSSVSLHYITFKNTSITSSCCALAIVHAFSCPLFQAVGDCSNNSKWEQ